MKYMYIVLNIQLSYLFHSSVLLNKKFGKNENRINISILKLCKVWVIYIVFNKQLSLAVRGVYT